MTFDELFRFVLLPAIGAGALAALIITVWVEYRDWRNGEWERNRGQW